MKRRRRRNDSVERKAEELAVRCVVLASSEDQQKLTGTGPLQSPAREGKRPPLPLHQCLRRTDRNPVRVEQGTDNVLLSVLGGNDRTPCDEVCLAPIGETHEKGPGRRLLRHQSGLSDQPGGTLNALREDPPVGIGCRIGRPGNEPAAQRACHSGIPAEPLVQSSWTSQLDNGKEASSRGVESRHEEALHFVMEDQRGSPHHQIVAIPVARDRHRFHQMQIDVGHLDDRARGQALGREALDSHAIGIGRSPTDGEAGCASARHHDLGNEAPVFGQHQSANLRGQRRLGEESEKSGNEKAGLRSHLDSSRSTRSPTDPT